MPLWFHNGKTIYFAHIPKAAGTSVQTFVSQRLGRPMMIWNHDIQTRELGVITPPGHFTRDDAAMFLPKQLDYCFAVVRHPLTRLESEFRYQLGSSKSSRLGFASWVHIMLHCVRSEPRIYDNHLRPQTDFIPDGAEIFRLEDGLERLVDRLDELLGHQGSSDIPRVNAREGASITWHRQEILAAQSYYARDFEAFGYQLDDGASWKNDPLAVFRRAQARLLSPALIERQRRGWIHRNGDRA